MTKEGLQRLRLVLNAQTQKKNTKKECYAKQGFGEEMREFYCIFISSILFQTFLDEVHKIKKPILSRSYCLRHFLYHRTIFLFGEGFYVILDDYGCYVPCIIDNKLMDSFFAKKGLTLSRNNNANNPPPSRDQLLRSQEQITRPPTHPPPNAIHSLHKHPPHQTPPIKPHNHTQTVTQNGRQEKSFSIGASIRLMPHRELQAHPPLPKPQGMKFSGFSPAKHRQNSLNSSREEYNQLSKISLADNTNRSFETSLSMVERQSLADRTDTYSQVKPANKLKMVMESHRMQTESAKTNKPMGYFQTSSIREQESSEAAGRASLQVENYSERASNQKLIALQREKQELIQELRKRDGKFIPQEWFQEKYALIKEINQKTTIIRDLQNKLASTERELKAKVSSLEFQVRMLENTRNRLQNQNQANRNQLRTEKEKHSKAKQQMHKLIFFQDDLIHAKDYSRLKEELENVLTENALMFKEHQQYILSVSQNRRALVNRLEEVQADFNALKEEYARHRAKIETFTDNTDDKMLIIKLQNQINFLRKKGEESTQALIAKERQLQQSKITLKQMINEQNQRSQSTQKFMDETNLQQIKDTIASYESRLADMAEALATKNQELSRCKAELQALAQEVRTNKEERHINSMKERSSQNSLRNQVQTLQRALQRQQEMSAKRTSNLQESLQRKSREITDKDAFIKNFLLSRAKQLQTNDAQTILQSLKQYFSGESR